jgi:hypothetical protein
MTPRVFMGAIHVPDDENDGASHRHPLDPMAQRMELADRFLRGNARPLRPLQPGDICRQKSGLNFISGDPVIVLWRWLNPDDPHDILLIRRFIRKHPVNRIDCIIGFLDDDAHTVLMVPGESWRLERLDDAYGG